jgi:drug/metabolite transporter (DMT)-like permease
MQPTRQDYGLLLALGAVWGSSFLLIKLAVDTIPPITVATGRIGIGAIVLALIVVVRRRAWPRRRREWLLLFAMGVVGNAIPFSLINWGETHIDSGLTAILMSSVPLATIMLAPAFVRDEPVTPGKLVGVALGMAGVAVLIGPGALMGAHGELLGEIAITCAALCYAVNGLVARQLPPMPVEVISAGCLLSATLVCLPLSLAAERPWQAAPSSLSLGALVLLGVLNTAGGYLLLFRLVVRAGRRVRLAEQLPGATVRGDVGRHAAAGAAVAARVRRPPADPGRARRRATVAKATRGERPHRALTREPQHVGHRVEAGRLALRP